MRHQNVNRNNGLIYLPQLSKVMNIALGLL